ncbi:CBS domain-containing protein [Ruminococcus sp. NK3A76]|uniref:CBS domain-containing protein n=1 Tax=Ruminococcus sp. NK3A76 TaxID=877411 RepID=UPI000491A86F|nr:CBS domain-containing protein [Ruminococcus sp. NK3A76]
MNMLSLLKPKALLDYAYTDQSVRQVLERLKNHGYTAIPVINKKGEYITTVTEGDILRFMLTNDILDLRELERIPITDIEIKGKNKPVYITSGMDELILLSMEQNFVPVIDDRNVLSGIVTRRDILQYCYNTISEYRQAVELGKIKENE